MNPTLMKLETLIMRELDRLADKSELSPSELEVSSKAVCLLKEMKEYESMGTMDQMMSNAYSENSYMRGRNPMNGQYMSRSYGMNSYDRMPMVNNGYSGHSIKDRMYMQMESMLGEAKTDEERRIIEEYLRKFNAE